MMFQDLLTNFHDLWKQIWVVFVNTPKEKVAKLEQFEIFNLLLKSNEKILFESKSFCDFFVHNR